MKEASVILLGLISGAIIGAALGFVYGGRVRDSAADAVHVAFAGGTLDVKVDAKQAARDGWRAFVGGL